MTAPSEISDRTSIRHFSVTELVSVPWKNGRGSTCEIVSWPLGADLDAFDWRISIATIAASGPFSVFEGVDRTIMLLEGDGVRLQSDDGSVDHLLDRPHQPFAFSGDLMLECTPIGRISTDFNVMSRRARGAAEVRVIDSAASLASSEHGVLMSLTGSWRANGEVLADGDGLWWAAARQSWDLTPDAPGAWLVSVNWMPVGSRDMQ